MKKNLFYLSAITLAVMATMIIFAMCKRECENCIVPPPDAKEQVTFNLMDNSLKTECSFYKRVVNGYYRELVYLPLEGETFFQFIKTYCVNNNITVDNQTMAFTLYYDSPISQTYCVTSDHIKGISVYNVEGRKIMHHLFVRDENLEFVEIINVKVAVPFLASNYDHFYLENYVFSDPQNRSYISIMGDYSHKVNKNIQKYKTHIRFEVKASKMPHGWSEVALTCLSPCPPTDRSALCRTINGEPDGCVLSGCLATDVCKTLSLSQKIERVFVNMNLMDSFRDNVLYNSEKGENYVDNYYYLSYEYEGKIGLSLAIQTALFFRDFNPVMEAFVNPTGHESEIMFDDALTGSLLDLLNQYETITTSIEGKEILTSIRADINNFNGKTLQEVLALLQ